MLIFFLLAVAAFFLYYRARSNDDGKVFVNPASIQVPIGMELMTNGDIVHFWKLQKKLELHAFSSKWIDGAKYGVYLGEVPYELARRALDAIDRGGTNEYRITEVTNLGRLILQHQTRAKVQERDSFGFLKKTGFTHVEQDFEQEFNLQPATGQGGSGSYTVGVIAKTPQEVEHDQYRKNWSERLSKWWAKKKNQETEEEFDGLFDVNLHPMQLFEYAHVTGDKSVFAKRKSLK